MTNTASNDRSTLHVVPRPDEALGHSPPAPRKNCSGPDIIPMALHVTGEQVLGARGQFVVAERPHRGHISDTSRSGITSSRRSRRRRSRSTGFRRAFQQEVAVRARHRPFPCGTTTRRCRHHRLVLGLFPFAARASSTRSNSPTAGSWPKRSRASRPASWRPVERSVSR